MRVRSASLLGALPGMSAFATAMMKKEMEKLNNPPIPEFIEMIHDAGGRIYACKATVDIFTSIWGTSVRKVDEVLTVGEFYALSAGAPIIFA
jgi:peroxiredoxin family protein